MLDSTADAEGKKNLGLDVFDIKKGGLIKGKPLDLHQVAFYLKCILSTVKRVF
jgi:hypothetical protein